MVDIQGVPSGEVDGSGIKLHLTDPQAGQMYCTIYIIYTYLIYIIVVLHRYTDLYISNTQ